MQPDLPQFIDPLRLVKQGAQLTGNIEINDLPRLRAAVLIPDGALRFRLDFGRDDSGQPCIMGHLTGQVELTCQRCLQPLAVTIDTPIALGIVAGEDEAHRLATGYEPLQVSSQLLKLNDLIEDEALLALPLAPLHNVSQCKPAVLVDDDASATTDEDHVTKSLAEQLATLRWKADKH